MAAAVSLALSICICFILFTTRLSEAATRYLESDNRNPPFAPNSHKHFLPLVAFQCGYRSKYMNEHGEWQDDPSSAAGCLHGRLNILKYCKRVYQRENITNIVEYSHLSRISNWCKEDGSDCHSKFTIRPFRCLEGEFMTESLQVPSKCHFSHVAGKDKCNDYNYWNEEAENQCAKKLEEGTHQSMRLHSFSILEPCGLDMFRGVEFVCCPKSLEEKIENVVQLEKDSDDDDDEDDEYDSDDEDDDDEDETSSSSSKTPDQDPYFKENPTGDEHERFRDAIERLERKHRKRVTKVITQWSELFDRYNKMKEKDPKGAENYKREMTSKFRKTVASLEEENREQRKQIEEIHNERVQTALNEKKRQATHEYRTALALQVSSNNKNEVLRTLKSYIRAEEKDRLHMLNRFRRLLRSDPDGASQFEPVLLHRLRYIDLRINGTLAMLRDFPALEKEIRPLAEIFWRTYRYENTPEGIGSNEPHSENLTEDERNEQLIKFYKKTFEKDQQGGLSRLTFVEPEAPTTTTKPSTPLSDTKRKSMVVALKDVLSEKDDEDSDEDQFEDEDDDVPVTSSKPSLKSDKKLADALKKYDLRKEFLDTFDPKSLDEEKPVNIVKVPILTKTVTKSKNEEDVADNLSNDEEDDDDSDEAEEKYSEPNTGKKVGTELRIGVAPILVESRDGYIVNESELEVRERNYILKMLGQTNLLIGLMVLTIILVFVIIKRRNHRRHRGFIEVEIHNPEDKHVNGMQANGYANPTYEFFETKP